MRLKPWLAVLWILLLLFGQTALQLHSLEHLETPAKYVLAGDDQAESCPTCLIALPLQSLMVGVSHQPPAIAGMPLQVAQVRLLASPLYRGDLPAIRGPPTFS